MGRVVIFEVAAQRFGLPLESVEQVVRIVEVTPLPKAPGVVAGVINVHGTVIPVINIRSRFRFPQRERAMTDQLIIATASQRRLALCVDSIGDVAEYRDEEFSAVESVVPGMEYLQGIVRLADGLVLIQDLAKLLSLEEERALDEAIGNA